VQHLNISKLVANTLKSHLSVCAEQETPRTGLPNQPGLHILCNTNQSLHVTIFPHTHNKEMIRRRPTPAALPPPSMATSTMDPNRGAAAPYESIAGAWRSGDGASDFDGFC
jgi:hypothetical protein